MAREAARQDEETFCLEHLQESAARLRSLSSALAGECVLRQAVRLTGQPLEDLGYWIEPDVEVEIKSFQKPDSNLWLSSVKVKGRTITSRDYRSVPAGLKYLLRFNEGVLSSESYTDLSRPLMLADGPGPNGYDTPMSEADRQDTLIDFHFLLKNSNLSARYGSFYRYQITRQDLDVALSLVENCYQLSL